MNIEIVPELSALGIKKAINPMLLKVNEQIKKFPNFENLERVPAVVDLGCGQLRNLKEFEKHFSNLYLVDSERQFQKKHNFYGDLETIPEFIEKNYKGKNIKVLNFENFASSDISANLIFLINVLDVTPSKTRNKILRIARQRLSKDGYFIVITPRNDSHTLKLCTDDRKFEDGYFFPNRNYFTFYKNWSNQQIKELFDKHRLKIVKDLSIYRYSCCILKR